jgi:hypothetical protein
MTSGSRSMASKSGRAGASENAAALLPIAQCSGWPLRGKGGRTGHLPVLAERQEGAESARWPNGGNARGSGRTRGAIQGAKAVRSTHSSERQQNSWKVVSELW